MKRSYRIAVAAIAAGILSYNSATSAVGARSEGLYTPHRVGA